MRFPLPSLSLLRERGGGLPRNITNALGGAYMKDYYGKRIPLRWRWEAFTQDLREDLAIYGLRQLVGGIWDWRWHKYVVNHWLRSPLGTFIRKGRRYDDVVVSCRELTDLLRAHEAQDNAEIWELRKQVASWQSFYDWLNDEGRVQEHVVEPF